MESFNEMYSTFPALVGAIILISQFVINWIENKFGELTKIWKWISVHILGILLGLFGWYMKFGILSDLTFVNMAILAFVASLSANGIFDMPIMKSLLKALKILKK